MSVRVRPAEDGDLAAIQTIYADAVLNGFASFELVPPPVEEMRARRSAIIASGFPYLVAEDDGAILGYAYANLYRARPAYRFTVENSVYVAPWAGRRGVGRLLMNAVIAACEAKGCRQMIAVIGDSGNVASIALHASLGFERVGLLPSVGWKHGRWVDSVLMQRPLGAGEKAEPSA